LPPPKVCTWTPTKQSKRKPPEIESGKKQTKRQPPKMETDKELKKEKTTHTHKSPKPASKVEDGKMSKWIHYTNYPYPQSPKPATKLENWIENSPDTYSCMSTTHTHKACTTIELSPRNRGLQKSKRRGAQNLPALP
jgi:hypothetical protein